MIATDEDSRIRSNLQARIVFPEGIHREEFVWYVEAFQIILVPHGLKIAATEKKIDFGVISFLEVLKGFVDIV